MINVVGYLLLALRICKMKYYHTEFGIDLGRRIYYNINSFLITARQHLIRQTTCKCKTYATGQILTIDVIQCVEFFCSNSFITTRNL